MTYAVLYYPPWGRSQLRIDNALATTNGSGGSRRNISILIFAALILCTFAAATPVKIHPIQDRVIVKSSGTKEIKSAGGIVIPDTAKEKPQGGMVIAVGPGRNPSPPPSQKLEVKVGDTVLFSKYKGKR